MNGRSFQPTGGHTLRTVIVTVSVFLFVMLAAPAFGFMAEGEG
jgi:hypothetical protein